MLQAGFIEEVRCVRASGVPGDAPGLDAVGYGDVVAHLEGRLSLADLPEAIAAATRKYARRQETWFRNQLRDAPVVTLDASEPPDVLARRVVESWNARG